jgi:predicted GIY-YIG superfamily endonuclease
MLFCSDDSIYVGRTDDLEARLRAHRTRRFSGYTAKRLPVRLIFYEQFGTREEAFAAERRIKGWSAPRSSRLPAANGIASPNSLLYARRIAEELLSTVGAPFMVRVPHHERFDRHST